MLLGTSGHLVQPCETDPMGPGFTSGRVRLRRAYVSLTVCLRPGFVFSSKSLSRQ